jgi:hypothetical protein
MADLDGFEPRSPSLLARVGPLLVSLALLAAILMIFAAWVAALVLVARLACGGAP